MEQNQPDIRTRGRARCWKIAPQSAPSIPINAPRPQLSVPALTTGRVYFYT